MAETQDQPSAPTAAVAEIDDLAQQVTSLLFEMVRVGSRRTRLLGSGSPEILRGLARIEKRTTRSVWNSNPVLVFDPEDLGLLLNERSDARGLENKFVTTALTIATNPLLVSTSPYVRVGPASLRMILADESLAIIAGPQSPSGETTAWTVETGELFTLAYRYMTALIEVSVPVLAPGEPPPLNARQVAVARLLCLGHTDTAIAHKLGISTRSVEREVAVVLQSLGARARTEAVLNMMGRGRSSSALVRGSRGGE